MVKLKYSFISFEGIEGSGKSTQAKLLSEFLSNSNIDFLLTREPGGSKVSEKIREILISEEYEKLNSKTELLLNFAARIEHVEKTIKPALNQGKIVICDRFADSTYAYQGNAFGIEKQVIDQIAKISLDDFAPQITFLIDVPLELGFARINNRSTNNRYEKLGLDFHQKVYLGYQELAKKNKRIIKIDGSKAQNEIAQEILNFLL